MPKNKEEGFKRSAELAGAGDANLDDDTDLDLEEGEDEEGEEKDKGDAGERRMPKKKDDDDAGDDEDDDDDEAVEARARKLGWVPENNWRGNKEWVPARQFLERSVANRSLFKPA